MIHGVAFDFDGVLVGLEAHSEARVQAFEEFAVSTSDERFLASPQVHEEAHLHGSHPRPIIGWVLQRQGLIEPDVDASEDPLTYAVVERKQELYIAMANAGFDALDGSLDCVDWAADTFGEGRTAIVTTARPSEVYPFISRHSLDNKVGLVVTGEDVDGHLKPHPLAYDLAVRGLVLDPSECIAIEDSVRGLQSAQAAGLVAIGITTTHTAEQLIGHADYIVESFESIPELVASL